MIFKDIAAEENLDIFEKSTIAVMIDNKDGKIEYVNKKFCELFGYSKAELKQLKDYKLIHADDRDRLINQHMARLKNKKSVPVEYELRAINKSGNTFNVWAMSFIKFDNKKKPIGTINYLWDITRWKKLEESLTERESELIQSEIELQGIIESTADGILVVDTNGKVLKTNKMFAKMWKIPNEIMETGDDDILLSHILDQMADPEQFLTKVKELYNSNERDFDSINFKDGRIFERYSRPLLIGAENLGRIWSFRDITERVNAEKALKESEEKNRSLIENSPIIIIRLKRSGEISFINYEYADKTPEELIGKIIYDFIPKEFKRNAQETIERVFETKQTLSFENIELSAGEKVKWFRNNVSPEKPSGDVDSVIMISMDITELKQLDIMRSEFVASVSHEIRTPLTIIRESLSILESGITGPLSNDQLDIVNPCLDEVDRLSRIINNLLDMTKMDNKKIKLELEMVNIIDLAKSVLYSFQSKADSKGISLEFKSKMKELQVYCDRDRIIQVFMNLIGNAAKFTNSGFIRVSITEEGDEILCSIADSGEGIEEESLGTVFDSFHQVGKVIKAGEKGTGLGLTISKGIVKSHKGKIWVKSKLGVGSEFFFTLPNISTEKFILQNIEQEIQDAKTQLTKTSLLLLRIDNYNWLIDKFGLDNVTRIRDKIFREVETEIAIGDFLQRYSESEFVMQSNITKQNMMITVSKVKAIMNSILGQYEKDLNLDISTGIAVYPDDGETSQQLWKIAQNRLITSKKKTQTK